MTLEEVIDNFKGLGVHITRRVTDKYIELVFYNKDIEKWHDVFSATLGPVVKPKGIKPTKEIQQIAEEFGGIHENQVLYKRDFADSAVIAMFWPWQDDTHTTLKLILIKK